MNRRTLARCVATLLLALFALEPWAAHAAPKGCFRQIREGLWALLMGPDPWEEGPSEPLPELQSIPHTLPVPLPEPISGERWGGWEPEYYYFDFRIPESQLAQAQKQVDFNLVNSSLFILPRNDGEAERSGQILRALRAPYVKISHQPWGATLDREWLPGELPRAIKRVVVFEMPSLAIEQMLRDRGLEVMVIDHHTYEGLDRHRPESSIEQLMNLLHWPASRLDLAIATNDRSYISGLKKLGLSNDEIREIRNFDYHCQGRSWSQTLRAEKRAMEQVQQMKPENGIYVLDNLDEDDAILKQELAIASSDGVVNTLVLNPSGISFSGSPTLVKKLLALDPEALGYARKDFNKYGGGDSDAAMFFGFKAKAPPMDSKEFLSPQLLSKVWEILGLPERTPRRVRTSIQDRLYREEDRW